MKLNAKIVAVVKLNILYVDWRSRPGFLYVKYQILCLLTDLHEN